MELNQIYLKMNDPNDPSTAVKRFKDKSLNPDRTVDRGIVNEENASSLIIKENGNIVISSDETSNIKINQEKVIETTSESVTICNRKILRADETIINNQKLNPQLLELSDTKVLFDNPKDSIGNLMMDGTVLVKAWEPHLKKYVLIRRKIRTPLFSHKLNKPEVPEFIDTTTDYITDLTVNTAMLIREEKVKKEKITAQEEAAQGGMIYDQGDYNNYLTDFIYSSNSITGQGGIDMGYNDNGYTSVNDIISPDSGATPLAWPVPEYHGAYSSGYGPRGGTHHNGVDIPPNPSLHKKTKIVAAEAGVVTSARAYPEYPMNGSTPFTGYGQVIEIEHHNGLKTLYAHLDKVRVKEGQEVARGQHIGEMGCSGQVFSSTGGDGTHLHFTVWGTWNGKTVNRYTGFDPKNFIKPQN